MDYVPDNFLIQNGDREGVRGTLTQGDPRRVKSYLVSLFCH